LTAWIALGLTVETMIFVAAGFAWLRSKGYTLAEAFAGAVLIIFIFLSLIHQASLAMGSVLPGMVLESVALIVVLSISRRWLPKVARALASVRGVLFREGLPGWIILAAWICMAGLAAAQGIGAGPLSAQPLPQAVFAAPPDGLNLLVDAGPLPALNSPALFFHTARFGLGANACGFGLLAYLSLGCCTYALARRYAWPPMALTIALMVLSMPRLVYLGLRPSPELISSAAIAYSLVLIYRLIEQHRSGDLRLLLLGLLFSLHSNVMSIALVPVMALFLLVVMIRRHGWLLCRELVADRPLASLGILLPAVALAQIPVGFLNLSHGHPLLGVDVSVDDGGIVAAAANLVRYVLAGIDFTEPVRQMLVWMAGVDLDRLLKDGYNALIWPLFQHADVQAPFDPVISGRGQMGFGPFAVLLVMPAMGHALMRGPRRLKALCVAWAGYLYLAALVASWSPDRIAVLTPLLATCGFMVAFSLPPWRLRRRGMRLLQIDFALLWAWSIVRGGWWPG